MYYYIYDDTTTRLNFQVVAIINECILHYVIRNLIELNIVTNIHIRHIYIYINR